MNSRMSKVELHKELAVAIQHLAAADVPEILNIISAVRNEFGLIGRVSCLLEPADLALYETYRKPYSAYFVARNGDRILGGAGIAPLNDGDGATCELQRMYLSPESRGTGIGQALLDQCLAGAREFGFRQCYAETIAEMKAALAFYERNGFRRISKPLGDTGHRHNDCWLLLAL